LEIKRDVCQGEGQQEIKRERAKIKRQKEKQGSFEPIFDFCPLLFAF
jgi:hypothetical protein